MYIDIFEEKIDAGIFDQSNVPTKSAKSAAILA